MTDLLVYPRELTPALRWVLGRMCFETGPVANLFREAGHEIPRKIEEEQAFVLHWLTTLALEHGERCGKVAAAKIEELKGVVAEKRKAGGVGSAS